jgi:hypothetical protein
MGIKNNRHLQSQGDPDLRKSGGRSELSDGGYGFRIMPSTAKKLGTSTGALAGMTAEGQLDYVEKYFQPHTNKLTTLEDVYMAILWPVAIGKPNSEVLFSKRSTAYTQNAGLDANNDGKITKEEAAARVRAKLEKGLAPNRLA